MSSCVGSLSRGSERSRFVLERHWHTRVMIVRVLLLCSLTSFSACPVVVVASDASCPAPMMQVDAGATVTDAGTTTDAGTSGGSCHSNTDCATGQGCSYSTGTCVALEGAVCGVPMTGSGATALGIPCMATTECSAGLTCVPRSLVGLPDGATTYSYARGICLSACNPCSSACATGLECVALGSGVGGFCVRGGLRAAGTSCAAAVCGSQGTCLNNLCSDRVCRPVLTGAPKFYQGYPSADCSDGEGCVMASSSLNGNVYVCTKGKLVSANQPCGTAQLCSIGPCRSDLGLCVPPCGQGNTCAAGSTCSGLMISVTGPVCVPDRSLQLGELCLENVNCASNQCTMGRCR